MLTAVSVAGQFNHLCENCGHLETNVPIDITPGTGTLVVGSLENKVTPGDYGISRQCPACGAWRGFNTNLAPDDPRFEASLIRALQTHAGLQVRTTPLTATDGVFTTEVTGTPMV